MASKRFLNYITHKFSAELYQAVDAFVAQHAGLVQEKLSRAYTLLACHIDEAEPIEYRSVRLSSEGETGVGFRILAVPTVVCEVIVGKYRDHDTCEISDLWLEIIGDCKIADGIQNFRIVRVCEYARTRKVRPLSDDLIPVIAKEEYDDYATALLRTYYPEALETPMRLDPVILAARMGLTVRKRRLSSDGSIFGQLHLGASEISLPNGEMSAWETVHVPANTILVDERANMAMSFGSESITIAHECVHYYLHRKAFLFEQLSNSDISYIRCHATRPGRASSGALQSKFVEIQANAIAPCVLMPGEMFLKVYHEHLSRAAEEGVPQPEAIEQIIRDMANFFHVTRNAVKKRLTDLGVECARGALNWIDGHYVRPYTYRAGALAADETYTVSCRDICDKVIDDPRLAMYIYRGEFIFAENHLCVRREKYVSYDDCGVAWLSDYARTHMDECCIKFRCVPVSPDACEAGTASFCYLCRSFAENMQFLLYPVPDGIIDKDFCQKYGEAIGVQQDVIREIERLTVGEILSYFIDKLGISLKELEIDADVDERTIRRARCGETVPEKRTLIALCIAMGLPPEFTCIALTQAGYTFALGNSDDNALHFLLHSLKPPSVKMANQYLHSIGHKPLTRRKQ